MTLALAVIVKDEIEQIQRIISEYADYFDELVFCYDDDVIEDFEFAQESVRMIKYERDEWENKHDMIDFARKRNFLASQIKSDYYVRIDTDDKILFPEKIRAAAEQTVADDVDILYCLYNYSRDQWGQINACHRRETFIKNSDNLYWNKKIHENVLPKNRHQYNIAFDDNFIIEHLVTPDHSEKSSRRNMKYLLLEYEEDKENTDPRTLAYLGRVFMAYKELDKALFFLYKHIERSGWDEDRYMSYCQMSEIFREQKQYEKAISAAMEAMVELPNYPDAYICLHDIYSDMKKWRRSIHWGLEAMRYKMPRTFVMVDESKYSWRLSLSMAFVYLQAGEADKAMLCFNKARNMVPEFEAIKDNEGLFTSAYERMKYVQHLGWMYQYIKDNGTKENLKELLTSIPDSFKDHEVVIKMKNISLEPKQWSDKSIVLFCGTTSEEWWPGIVETGIGGSEEAAIYLSKELVRQGYEVTVYNNCGDHEGIYDGVEYLPYYRFNKNDKYNILISWRTNIFTFDIEAQQKIVWLHDIPWNIEFNEETAKTFDKIIALSQYHATFIPKVVPREKIFFSTNGIVPEDFKGLGDIERNPHRMIYASSYNRGLEQLLEMWPDIKQSVPDAEIHIFYGWQVYDEYVASGDIDDGGFKYRMLKLMAQDGVYEHGRIGHKELLEEYAKSGLMAYPCSYAGEINCIALTKAIACGCRVVTNDFAVCPERNPDIVATQETFRGEIIKALNSNNAEPRIETAYILKNSWETVAKDWKERLLNEVSCVS